MLLGFFRNMMMILARDFLFKNGLSPSRDSIPTRVRWGDGDGWRKFGCGERFGEKVACFGGLIGGGRG